MNYRELIAVVTGASTGIGRETAIALARRGATVIGIARGAENLARLQESARGLSGTVETAQADVSDAETITATLRRLERTHGRVDVLVNNAGTGAYKPAVRTSAVEFESIMRTNYLGAVASARVSGCQCSAAKTWSEGMPSTRVRAAICRTSSGDCSRTRTLQQAPQPLQLPRSSIAGDRSAAPSRSSTGLASLHAAGSSPSPRGDDPARTAARTAVSGRRSRPRSAQRSG